MSKLLIAISILAGAALLADAPTVAVLIAWIGLAGVVAMVFGAAALMGKPTGDDDSRAS